MGTLRLVLEGQAYRPALLNLNSLALCVDNKSIRRFGLCDHYALAGLQALDQNFSIFISAINAVGVSDKGAVSVHNLELSILEGYAGVDGADLADEQIAVRHILKADGDNALLSVVRQINCFGGLDNGVPIRRIYLLQDIGTALEPRPDGGTIFAGHLLPDDCAACAAGSTQVAQLEGAAGQSLAGHTVILFNSDGIQRFVLECDSFALTAMENDLLRSRFLHLETGCWGHLCDGKLAGIEPLALLVQLDFTIFIGQNIAVVNGGRSFSGLAVGHIGDVEFRTLDGAPATESSL